jgi:hypothetical protein
MNTFVVHVSWVLECFDDVEVSAEGESEALAQAEALRQFAWERTVQRDVRAIVLSGDDE